MTKTKKQFEAIPQHRRELYFKIIDTYQNIHPITLRLYFLNDHFPPQLLDFALHWLIRNRFVGQEFVLWFQSVCKNSDLEMQRYLLAQIQRDNLAPLVAGKNFIL